MKPMIRKTTITMLTLIMAVSAISMTYALPTFFGENCEDIENKLISKTCGDLNNLNNRVLNLESTTPYQVETQTVMNGRGLLTNATASCNVGNNTGTIIAGGYEFSWVPFTLNSNISYNGPLGDDTWLVQTYNNVGSYDELEITVHAICLP